MPGAKEAAIKFAKNHLAKDGKAVTDKQIDVAFDWLVSMAKTSAPHLVDTIRTEHVDWMVERQAARFPATKRTTSSQPSASPARPSTERPISVTKALPLGWTSTERPFGSIFEPETASAEPTMPKIQAPSLRAFEHAGQFAGYTPLEGF
jgi:hypothetical protein